jgi:1,4-alpha-glucan branching enzyme
MKRFLPLFLFFFAAALNAQILTWSPYFATKDDSITIIYDASEGNGALAGVIPIYVHTGVITNLSTSPTDWKYVKTVWGQNTNQPQMNYLGNNRWRFTIHIPSYYQVPANEEILQLAFVFRNSAGSIVGRDTDGSDIFLPLFKPGLNAAVVSPNQTPLFVEAGDSLLVEAASISSDNLSLFINDTLIEQTNGTSIQRYVHADYSGKFRIKVIADSSSKTAADSTYFIVKAPSVVEARPSGVEDGINYITNNSVILSLYAPLKQSVYVIGDFTNWEVDPSLQMKITPNDSTYWIEVSGLSPGTEYRFQYLIDENLRVADPYSEKILDPWNDQYITDATYPGLIEYPAGKTSQVVSVLQTAQPEFQWNHDAFQKPAKEDLVIYELLLRDFLAAHNYKTLIDTLGYLQRLGINAIELMPVMEFEGNESWGYNPMFHLAPDKYYGPKEDLKRFIDTCHSMGIAVILDMVLNHAFGQSPLVRMYWDAVNNRPAANSPFFNPVAKHDYNVGYDFNHESSATKYFVDRVNQFWLEEYKFDGFRFDLSKGFTQKNSLGNVGLWGQYDQSRIDLLKRMADEIWETDPEAIIILEHFADNSEETVLQNYGMMFWGNMNHNYSEASMGYHDNGKSNLIGASYTSRGWNEPNLISFMESHDEERLMYKNIQYGNASGGYNIKDLGTALNRVKLAAAFYFTIPGPKMIWQFGELGYDYSIDYNGRVGNKPIRWDYYNDLKRRNLYKTFAALISLKQYDAFRSDNFSMDAAGSVKRINIYHDSMDVSIIGNFDVIPRDASPNFSRTGVWYDYFSGDSIDVSNTSALISLQPGEFHIYTTAKLPAPEPGILTGVDDEEIISGNIPENFELDQNYPNPFNPITNIGFRISELGFVNLKVYDVLGTEVATLINEEMLPGFYDITWNAEGLSSGVYFYKLEAGAFREVKKMILMK